MDELVAKGEQVYQTACSACHQANGQGIPNVFPALAGSALATTGAIEEHADTVVNGRAGTAMQAFGAQLDDVELAAVITYTRNAWGNETGSSMQPAQIKAMR